MTAPLRCTPRPSLIPPSQNTAPVAEFRCLFTHDIRRKQKRWQDGYLKFHTFNSRVMVYDQSRNYLGDTYYKESNELQEGDELSLDKGVMVEVAEAIGVIQTDLTPLFEKKTKESPIRQNVAPQVRPLHKSTPGPSSNALRTTSQLRHKSLNSLLGPAKGPIGKAVPVRSPFEARREKENELVGEPPAKRQKISPQSATWKASNVVEEEVRPAKEVPPLHPRALSTKNIQKPAKFIPPAAEVINLEPEEPDHAAPLFSDVTLPDTPPRALQSRAERTDKPVVAKKTSVQTPRLPRGRIPLPGKKFTETPKSAAPPSSPPVSASNRLSNVDFAVQPAKQSRKEPSPVRVLSPPQHRKAKSLRLPTGVKRKKLLCQSLPQAPRISKASARGNKSTPEKSITRRQLTPATLQDNESHSHGDSSPVRRETEVPNSRQNRQNSVEGPLSKRRRVSPSLSQVSLDILDDPEVVHGILDQQLLVPSSPPPESPGVPSSPLFEDSQPKSAPGKRPTVTNYSSRKDFIPQSPSLEMSRSTFTSPKKKRQKATSLKLVKDKPQPVDEPPISPISVPPSRDVSPIHLEAAKISSRTPSVSPTKKALSTGGFPKKRQRQSKKSSTTEQQSENPVPVPPRRNETVPLPPHPLRADKTGPVMTTTELASVLQKPKQSRNATDTAIQDAPSGSKNSPNRNLRRVRSENDALIPSKSEAWEKKNLPKTSSTLTEEEEDTNHPAAINQAPRTTTTAMVPPTVQTTTTLPASRKPNSGGSSLSALIKRTDPQRKKLNRTQSLVVQTNLPTTTSVTRADTETTSPVVAPPDTDIGPWSTEAFDLMDWRPPGR